MLHVVLVEPEIPPNTGNIARLCLAAGARLHLVEPLGFSLDEKMEKGLLGAVRGLFDRRYEEKHAVAGITFSLKPGELVGFLGPNGAGKTTTLQMLSIQEIPIEEVIRRVFGENREEPPTQLSTLN